VSRNERTEIESEIERLLQPLKTDAILRSVVSVGGEDYFRVLKAAMATVPFAMIKYTGKAGSVIQGGLMHYEAEVSVLVGQNSFSGILQRRKNIHEILEAVEDQLALQRIRPETESYYPLILTAEQWSEISGGGLEVWEQRYQLAWEEHYES